jgi:thioredoxin reductase
MTREAKPVIVIGGGPVGLAAAAQLAMREMPYRVLEASDEVAACFRATAHVRLFSPWRMNVDRAAARLLESHAWIAPNPDAWPTAGELRTQYLQPLARALAPHVRFDARVTSVSRRGFDKVKTAGRERAPFVVRVRTNMAEEELEASAVIDASGTWATPNWMGAHGLPALGEERYASRIRYGMPDVLGAERARYANKHVLVVGSGHSAAGSLIALALLTRDEPGTRTSWAIRGADLTRIFGGGATDGLPERGKLGSMLRQLTQTERITLHREFHLEAVGESAGALRVEGSGPEGATRVISEIDEIIVATGARTDLALARELRLRLDPWLESTEQLAPLIDPNVHSCGSVPPHGHRELAHPEPGYYAVGAKSYGRAPNFLLATGYEQARSVVAALAGDMRAADDVQLELPETGVCSTDNERSATGQGGCAAPPSTSSCCAPQSRSKPKSGCCR